MKKIMITIGDSYMCPVTNHIGTHFSELVAKKLNYDHKIFARGGMSNGGISLQIESAIQAKPDLILIGTTLTDRLEWPIKDTSVKKFSVNNIVYKHETSVSSHVDYVGQDPIIVSTNLREVEQPSFFKTNFATDPLAADRIKSLKLYLQYLYHPDWKRQIDHWCLYAALHKLELSQIPYRVVIDPFNLDLDSLIWLNDKNYLWHTILCTIGFTAKPLHDPGYHTPYEFQEQLAELVLKHV